jgi:tetratricopeptide (TPR) repeat protein
MPIKRMLLACGILLATVAFGRAEISPQDAMAEARRAYDVCDYVKAASVLQQAAAANPSNSEIHFMLAKTYYEAQQHDAAIDSAEKAVALDPRNSLYHEWLGRVYGEKADHAGMFSALSLAKKARREFEKAVELNERNFGAQQALIEFDCSAPGIAGGGEDKARTEIAAVASLDVAEGHYAAGNCRRQKKDFDTADQEFDKALANHPGSADLIYDIGDYAMKHAQPERLKLVVQEGERAAPGDPRGGFYQAVALVLANAESDRAERLLLRYLKGSWMRNNYPRPWVAHEWLGRLYENRDERQGAIDEYETALKLNPKAKAAHEALKRLKKG